MQLIEEAEEAYCDTSDPDDEFEFNIDFVPVVSELHITPCSNRLICQYLYFSITSTFESLRDTNRKVKKY